MVRVDFRDDDGDVRIAASGGSVGEHGKAPALEGVFRGSGRRGGEGAEDDPGSRGDDRFDRSRLNRCFSGLGRKIPAGRPFNGRGVRASGRALRAGEKGDFEIGMALEHPDEMLPHQAGRA